MEAAYSRPDTGNFNTWISCHMFIYFIVSSYFVSIVAKHTTGTISSQSLALSTYVTVY